LSCDIGSEELLGGLSAVVENMGRGGGENDIYSKLSQLLAQPYS